jgi:hypothetical protein
MRPGRRRFLQSLGLSAAAAPLLPLLNQEVEAQAGTFPCRFLLVFTGNGSVPSQFWPEGSGSSYTFRPGSITEPLSAFKSKLIFPKGLARVQTGAGGHESAMVPLWTCGDRNTDGSFGGYSKLPSVDQIIAQRLAEQTPFPSLEFGVMSDGDGANKRLLTVMSYAGEDQPVRPESNPYRMHERLMFESSGGQLDDWEKRRRKKQSAVDLLREELNGLERKIGREDRAKVEQHLEAIRKIERRLNMPPMDVPALTPDAPRTGIDLAANDSFPEVLDIQNALAVAALAGNRTRVASLMWGRSFSLIRHEWAGVSEEHHTLSHETDTDARRKQKAIEVWFMQRMAELLTLLDSVPEGDGTLLDNTMLIYANELAVGSDHTANPNVCFVAGGGAGKLKTGQQLDLGDTNDFAQLLCTGCHVMGLDDVERVGDLGKRGTIPAILRG